ncbi:MAG: CBS domain-containing protein [Thermodesulfovibrionales bacterium]|nr:CBS domain-containing protein [Thermodesulfovibrionales bacterium]
MAGTKTVKDLMVGVFDFPHIPYWFTIRQAIGIIRVSFLSTKKYPQPMAILVFDEKYNLLGTLGLKDILRGLEPRFLRPTTKAQVHAEDESGLSVLWDTPFDTESKKNAERPVSEVMTSTKFFVKPEDPITKAAYLMVHNDLALLPVLEDKKKFVGLIRMIEIFDELSTAILAE